MTICPNLANGGWWGCGGVGSGVGPQPPAPPLFVWSSILEYLSYGNTFLGGSMDPRFVPSLGKGVKKHTICYVFGGSVQNTVKNLMCLILFHHLTPPWSHPRLGVLWRPFGSALETIWEIVSERFGDCNPKQICKHVQLQIKCNPHPMQPNR